MGVDKRRALSFGKSVPAGDSDKIERQENRPGSIEYVEVRIYPGPETDLELTIQTVSDGGTTSNVVTLEGKSHIDGDDDVYRWTPSHEFDADDSIRIAWTNQDGANSYDFRVNMDLEYRSTKDRIAAALRGAF